MSAAHMIAQCVWHTQFDQEQKSTALQDFISQWSNTVLAREMEYVFSSRCPHGQTWRIEQLTLDLGTIDLDDAPHELPRRLREKLRQALDRLMGQGGNDPTASEAGQLVILDQQESAFNLIAWFLARGHLPWWYQGPDSPLQLIDRYMQEQPRALAQLLRRDGENEHLRLRIVRQFGLVRLRRLVHVLAPWHAKWICAYADQIMQLQKTENVPVAAPAQYQELTWQFILTHLLIDRGSLFNTASFIGAHLALLAQHYQIAYAQLLHHVLLALDRFEKKGYGSVDQRLMAALRVLERERPDVATPVERAVDDGAQIWKQMQIMLHAGARRRMLGQESVHVEQLFLHLAEQDAPRLAKILRREGKSDSVRAAILRNFSERGLYQLVLVVEPQEHVFISSHVDHVKGLSALIRGHHFEQKMVWQVVLAYLLVERGSYFQRRQMVSNTLQSLCEQNQLDYANVLNLLMHAVPVEHISAQRFALLVILRDLHRHWQEKTHLQKTLPPQRAASLYFLPPQARAAWEVLAGLSASSRETGQAAASAELAELAAGDGGTSMQRVIAAQLFSDNALLLDLLRCEPARVLSSVQLSQAVLDWIGLSRLPRLTRMIDPHMAQFSLPLLHALMAWQARGWLACFDGMDISRALAVAMLDSLPQFRRLVRSVDVVSATMDDAGAARQAAPGDVLAHALVAFWRHFVSVLQHQFGVVRTQLIAQLGICLQEEAEAKLRRRAYRPSRIEQPANAALADKTIADIAACVSDMPEIAPRYLMILDIMLSDTESGRDASDASDAVQHSDRCDPLKLQFAHIEAYLTGAPTRLHGQPRFVQAWRQLGPDALIAFSHHVEQSSDKATLLSALGRHAQVPVVEAWWNDIMPDNLLPAQDTIGRLRGWLRAANAWHGAEAVLERQMQREFWNLAFDLRAQQRSTAFFLSRLLLRLCARLPLSLPQIVRYFRSAEEFAQAGPLHDMLRECEQLEPPLSAARPHAVAVPISTPDRVATTAAPLDARSDETQLPAITPWRQDGAGEYLWHPRMADLLRHILRHAALPAWVSRQGMATDATAVARFDLSRLLQDASVMRPDLFYAVLRSLRGEANTIERVQLILPFHCLLHAMRASHAAAEANYVLLEHWYQCLEKIYARPEQSPRFDAQDLCRMLMHLVLGAWLRQDWNALQMSQLVAAFAWSAIRELGVSQAALQALLAPHVYRMPTPLRQAWQDFFTQQRQSDVSGKPDRITSSARKKDVSDDATPGNAPTMAATDLTEFMERNQVLRRQLLQQVKKNTHRHEIQRIPMHVGNAGMVLLHEYMARLLQLLGLMEDGKFVSRQAQHCAVHALQYLVTGDMQTQEHHLVLNKLLCGLPLHEAIPSAWDMSPSQQQICDGLLHALLQHWAGSGSHSAEGFRGAWLVRSGSLCETSDHWSLIVDKRSYDVLMGSIPFSYSVIKFPWMNKALYVTWPAQAFSV